MGKRQEIADKLKERIELVTTANGYTQDVKTVTYDDIRINIDEWKDWELPAVQIIDLAGIYNHEISRSRTIWNLGIECIMRSTASGQIGQTDLWNFMEDVTRSVMANPKLDLSYVQHVKLSDHQTDIHTVAPNHIGILGWQVWFYEPMTRTIVTGKRPP